MQLATLDSIDLAGKRVLIRVDVNVPTAAGKVTDDTRIQAIVPTVSEITTKGGKAILLAHFGRPKGQRVPEMSLRIVLDALSAALGTDVAFAEDCTGPQAEQAVAAMADGTVLLLENTRYHAGEEKNDPELAAGMAKLGDVFVNDAFSAAHRAHVSTVGLAAHMPAVAGQLMQAELEALHRALGKPTHPVVALVGGAKVSTKLDLIGNLIPKVDHIVIGGGMANTFLAAKGYPVGKSLCEHDLKDTALEILDKADAGACEIILPTDVVVAERFEANAPHRTVAAEQCPDDMMILDAGPDSVTGICNLFDKARTLVWNGPLGAFELPPFDMATATTARKAAALTEAGTLLSVAGGGDTVAALNTARVARRFSYVSTAGGAFLEWLEGKTLPGVEPLMR